MRPFASLLAVAAAAIVPPAASSSLSSSPPAAAGDGGLANATILIVRHAEKPDRGAGLTPAGEERARGYVGYFDRLRLAGGPVHIDGLLAAADTPFSDRSRLTLTPLSKVLRLPIRQDFASEDVGGAARWIAHHAAGRTWLVAWHHSTIPALIDALGGKPDRLLFLGRWPGGVYDQLVVLRYDAHGRLVPGQTRTVREDIRT